MRTVLATLALAALPLLDVQAVVLDTFKTGVDESNGNAILADDTPDTNWTVASGPGSDSPYPRTAIATVKEPGWYSGIPMAGTGLITRGTSYNGDNGTYAYQYQFTIDKTAYPTFTVGGLAWADDQVRVLLNGNEIMALSGVIWNAAPVSFTNATQSYFVNGLNTLTFEVLNSGGGPTALNVSGVVTGVPEAHEWAMMILAVTVIGYYRREEIARWWKNEQPQLTA